jgi:N-acetylmuramoyl-L-alanine amidase
MSVRRWSLIAMIAVALSGLAAAQTTYAVVTPDVRRTVSARAINGVDMLALDQLAPVFGFALREDSLAGGMTITTSRQPIVLTPGQSGASVGGRVLSMSAPVARAGRSWYVPVDFLSRVLAPASGQKIELRPVSRTILVGDVKWPQIAVRLERQGAGVRVGANIQPATPFKLTRDGNRISVKFDASAIDLTLAGASAPELVTAVRADGVTLIIDLGPNASVVRPTEDQAAGQLLVDVAPPPKAGAETPDQTMPASAGLHIIAIDAGHGGEELGVRSAQNVNEKDVTLVFAQQLKAAIDARLGIRVIFTRDGDTTLPLDRRTSLVNNAQADVLISFHADGALRPSVRGAQVLTLMPNGYQRRLPASDNSATVPVAGGGTRLINVVPWELAQLPFLDRSNMFAASVVQHLRERNVPLAAHAQDTAPLRLLAGANMPAILVNVGYLTNPDDAAALAGTDLPASIIDALMAALTELRTQMSRGGR